MYQFPPKEKASVAGETIEYVASGTGAPKIVLVSGAGGPIEGWHKVFEPLSSHGLVFAYNRPGTGGSSPPAAPQVGSHLVESLRAILQVARIAPPYVLVAHSLGGLVANLFARSHPSEVSAVVFLEATAPEDPAAMAEQETALQRLLRTALTKVFPPHANAEVQHVARTVKELQSAPAFPPIPLTVITGGSYAMAWATSREALALRAKHQTYLAGLSPMGRQLIASRSGHFPQFSEPELVVAAVREAANLSIERTSPGKPVAASHVKR